MKLLRCLEESDFSDEEIFDEAEALQAESNVENNAVDNPPDVVDAVDNPPEDGNDNQVPTTSRPMKWKLSRMDNHEPVVTELTADSDEPKGLLDAFFEYLNFDLLNQFVEQTNLYSVQNNNHNSINTSVPELLKYTGVEILMGTFKLPQARMYWSREGRFDLIANSIPRDRYFQLRQNIHFVDNTFPNLNDKLWKVRPLIDAVRNKCLTLPRSANLAVDEQMIPFAGKCAFRQYVPSKPNPLGLKNFVLAAPDGLLLDFLIYVGKGTVDENDLKEIGLGASVVKVLSETIPNTGTHVIYTDRFFTSVKLADCMLKNNIFITGTVMKNRTGGACAKLKDEKSLQSGEFSELVREDGKLCLVQWKDNKCVTLLSSCVGSAPCSSCKRWSKEAKAKIEVQQPAIVVIQSKYGRDRFV